MFSDKGSIRECRETRDAPPNDEGVDVVSSLVGVDSLQVHYVSDDVILITDSISS